MIPQAGKILALQGWMGESGKLSQRQGRQSLHLETLARSEAPLPGKGAECEPGSQVEWERKESQTGLGVKVEKGLTS